jgi:diguanylate cyclase (GGDEF)-like protein
LQTWTSQYGGPKRWLLTVAAVTLALHLYSLLPAVTPLASDAIAYLCAAIAVACGAAVCTCFVVRTSGATRYRWALVALSFGFRSLDYFGGAADGWYHLHGLAQFLNNWFAPIGSALFLSGLTAVYGEGLRLVRMLDLALVVALCGLRYAVEHVRGGIFPNTANHLHFILFVHLFAFVAACIVWLAARDGEEARFARLMMVFGAIQAVAGFFSNQVGYLWLHQTYGSPWFLTSTIGEFGFAVVAFRSLLQDDASHLLRSPSLLARSVMPSFLAAANIGLGVRLLAVAHGLGVAGIVSAVLCYAFRMAYLQRHYILAQNDLLSRNSHLEGLIDRDVLTDIGNRRSLAAALDRHCEEAFHTHQSVYLLLLDVDGFKQANDNFGHTYGDRCLVAIASALARELKPTRHHLLRYGGDEFAVVLRSQGLHEALRVAEYLRTAVEELQLGILEEPLSVSIGMAAATLPTPAIGNLIETADRALYRAKQMGRNRVEFDLDSLSVPETPALLQ